MTKQNIFFNRERYEKTLAWCKANGIVPQESKLRVSVPLVNGMGQYEFDIKEKADTIIGDVSLNRNDLFIPYGFALALMFDENIPTGKSSLLSYPILASKASEGFMTADAEAIYNGKLEIIIDQTQVNESFPTEVFRHVPETQPCVILDSDNNTVSTGLVPQFDMAEVMHPLAPAYFLQGTMDTKIKVTFNGNGSNFAIASTDNPTQASTTRSARLVFLSVGILVKNAADHAKLDALKL